MSATKIVEGVFAINKPKSISSAQVLRDVQKAFTQSKFFAPWLEAEHAKRAAESRRQRSRRRDKRLKVKLGHGGTLDPMATGVLIVGVGKGTKHLQDFLACIKTYEATVLFGAATDTYDILGKVLSKAPYAHLTRDRVESALDKFRGSIMQRPPLYSALRMDGKRLYEYAREGKEVPREIQERPVTAKSMTMREWLPGGRHPYTWPAEEAGEEDKTVAEKVLHLGATVEGGTPEHPHANDPLNNNITLGSKRQREIDDEDDADIGITPATKRREISPLPVMSGAKQELPESRTETFNPATAASSKKETSSEERAPTDGPPAARLSMTVTSGFYVRSLCHDLGQEVGSLGIMSELVRTRQADFELGRNVLEYDDLRKAEDVWAPMVAQALNEWNLKTTENSNVGSPGSPTPV
ncbi:MAG: hypothetical protein Q9223_000665 [Gallowayella weberi]